MTGTFSQIYIQVVFAMQGRQNLLQKECRDEVFKYMSEIIKNKTGGLFVLQFYVFFHNFISSIAPCFDFFHHLGADLYPFFGGDSEKGGNGLRIKLLPRFF